MQQYICHRIRGFDLETLEAWLPQLVALHLAQQRSREGGRLRGLIVDRCAHHVKFALQTTWWLRAHSDNIDRNSLEYMWCRDLIVQINAAAPAFSVPSGDTANRRPTSFTPAQISHRRSRSSGNPGELVGLTFGLLPSARNTSVGISSLGCHYARCYSDFPNYYLNFMHIYPFKYEEEVS